MHAILADRLASVALFACTETELNHPIKVNHTAMRGNPKRLPTVHSRDCQMATNIKKQRSLRLSLTLL